jgi:hypothetical protein
MEKSGMKSAVDESPATRFTLASSVSAWKTAK